MKIQKKTVILVLLMAIFGGLLIEKADAVGPKVSEIGNKHNLSALGRQVGTSTVIPNTSDYRATNNATSNPGGQQVCIFCHTPHSANISEGAPLWNRDFSSQTFSRYTSSVTMSIYRDATARTAAGYGTGWKPDGSTKLCLSCHDGVASLGNVLRGGPITMMTGKDIITGVASFKPDTKKMKSGHHPVSFTFNSAVVTAITNTGKTGYQLPLLASVKLDKNGKMQCTTCHNAHQNQSSETFHNTPNDTRKIAPFWVFHTGANTAVQDHDAVCSTCHPLTTPSPWPYP